jgi:hypothetical protein
LAERELAQQEVRTSQPFAAVWGPGSTSSSDAPRIQRLAEKPLYFRYKSLFKPLGVEQQWLDPDHHLHRAKFYLKVGRVEATHNACWTVLKAAPTHSEATALMARIERERGTEL